MIRKQLEIAVLGLESEPLSDATVNVIQEGTTLANDEGRAEFDSVRSLYCVDSLRPGFYDVIVNHPRFESQRRRTQVHFKSTQIVFFAPTS